MTETHWGRKESVVWPPHNPIYSYGAVFLALLATGVFLYSIPSSFRASAKHRMLLLSDGRGHLWYATENDVVAGRTPQPGGQDLSLRLSASAKRNGIVALDRSVPTAYRNASLRSYLKQRIYGGAGLMEIFERPLSFGAHRTPRPASIFHSQRHPPP